MAARGGGGISMAGIYGPGLSAHLEAAARGEAPAQLSVFDEDDVGNAPAGDHAGQLTLRLRKKRQAALLKHILKSGGYGDLARVASFHKGEG